MPDITRRTDGTFGKGQTGNPGGRPRTDPQVREALEQGGLAAAQKLVALVGSEDERVALAASQALLDRLYGKPRQALEVDGGRDQIMAHYHLLVQESVLRELERVHGAGGDVVDMSTESLAEIMQAHDKAKARGPSIV